MKTARFSAALLLLLSLPLLQGCFPVVATGVAVGVLTVTDRRTVGAQAEDEAIEWKVSTRVRERLGDKMHINVTSYNRKVLLTGEVPSEQAKAEIGEIATKVENVLGIFNEIQVAGTSSFAARGTDSYITSKVKTRFIDANQFSPNHVKVVTEAQVVYLLGIVNENEARTAIYVARTTEGVRKVVNVLEVVSEAETKRIDRTTGKSAAQPGRDDNSPQR
ncbi:MAG: putative periplasmic or secreted lipoprotein [Proteobacteria bacterium]|nr:putative periplasmic or secreted lipoprotein [Pseudomonadota bacterium]